MALVKCPECGKENVSDSAVACPSCGFGIKEYFEKVRKEEEEKRLQEEKSRIAAINKEKALGEAEKQRQEAERRKAEFNDKMTKTKPIIVRALVVISSIACISTVAFIIYSKVGKKEYREAKEYFNNGDYITAISMFENLGEYKDSQTYLTKSKEAQKALEEAQRKEEVSKLVISSIESFENQDYIAAYTTMITLFPDDFIGQNKTLDEYLYECQKYFADEGHRLFENHEYINAYKLFCYSYEYADVSYKDEYEACASFNYILGEWYWYSGSYAGYASNDTFNPTPICTVHIEEDRIYRTGSKPKNAYVNEPEWKDIDQVTLDAKHMQIPLTDTTFIKLPMNLTALKISYDYSAGARWLYKNESVMKEEIASAEENLNAAKQYRAEQKKKDELKEPSIGMSKNEVLKSTWGEPKEKNITTFSWGTREQWVYGGYRYIYFADERVVAISSH